MAIAMTGTARTTAVIRRCRSGASSSADSASVSSGPGVVSTTGTEAV
jgi:hypothetical protein